MQKVLLCVSLCVFIGLATATQKMDLTPLWEAWKYKHAKVYSEVEEAIRFAIFSDNHHKIMKLNQENSNVKFAINKFADLTATEFKQIYATSAFPEYNENFVEENTYEPFHIGALPASVDWRNKGAVTPVKNQGQCGSCWSFSTTGALEGLYFVDNGKLVAFSEQQIVDCASDAGQGCGGGWPYKAIEYAIKYGLETEADYPYTGKDGKCHYDASKAIKIASGYSFVTTKSTTALKTALVNQPVSVLIEADQSSFQFYSSGVISTGCGANIDHAVLAVGYDKIGVLEGFIVKNSWGADWGEQGYVYISTIQTLNNGLGACGILYQPVVPNK